MYAAGDGKNENLASYQHVYTVHYKYTLNCSNKKREKMKIII